METHELALCVINTGSHYDARVENFRKLTKRRYRAYIQRLVTAEAHDQRVKFGTKFMTHDINRAVDDVLDHMKKHMAEMV